MKVLGICGSPHRNGSTAYAMRFALELMERKGVEIQAVYLDDKHIHPCSGCFRCERGRCVHDDDMGAILEALRWCDGLVLASPVYMGMVTGQMKVMMDRTVALRVGGTFAMSGKAGAGIACAGFRNGGQELALQNMQTYFLQQDMAAVADGPPYSHSGAALAGKAEQDHIGLITVGNVVERLARILASRVVS